MQTETTTTDAPQFPTMDEIMATYTERSAYNENLTEANTAPAVIENCAPEPAPAPDVAPIQSTQEPAAPIQLDILNYTPPADDDKPEPEPAAPNTPAPGSKIITVDRRHFAAAIASAARTIDKRQTIPILSTARITAQGDRLTVTCTDLDTATRATIPAHAPADLDVCIPAGVLQDYLQKAPDGPIQIGELSTPTAIYRTGKTKHWPTECMYYQWETDEERKQRHHDEITGACSGLTYIIGHELNRRLTIAAGRSKFQPASVLPGEDFPVIPELPADAPSITTSAAELHRAFTRLLPIAKRGTKEYARTLYSCLNFQYSAGILAITATDGKTMATEPIQASASQNCAVIIHHDAAQQWQKTAKSAGPDAILTIRIGDNQATLETDNIEIITRAVEGEYPQPIEFHAATTLQLDRKQLTAALRRLSKSSQSDAGRLKLQYSAGLLLITTDEVTPAEYAENEEGEYIISVPATRHEAAREEVPTQASNLPRPDFLQYANHKLLTEAIKGEKANTVRLDYGTATAHKENAVAGAIRLNGCVIGAMEAPDGSEEPTTPQFEEAPATARSAEEVITSEEVAPTEPIHEAAVPEIAPAPEITPAPKDQFRTLRGAKQAGKLRGWQHTGTRRDEETGMYSIYEMDGDWVRQALKEQEQRKQEAVVLENLPTPDEKFRLILQAQSLCVALNSAADDAYIHQSPQFGRLASLASLAQDRKLRRQGMTTTEGEYQKGMQQKHYWPLCRQKHGIHNEKYKQANTAPDVSPIIGDTLTDERENAAWKRKELAAASAASTPDQEYSEYIDRRTREIEAQDVENYLGRKPRDSDEANQAAAEIIALKKDEVPRYSPMSARLLASLLPDAPSDEPPAPPSEPDEPPSDAPIHEPSVPQNATQNAGHGLDIWEVDHHGQPELRAQCRCGKWHYTAFVIHTEAPQPYVIAQDAIIAAFEVHKADRPPTHDDTFPSPEAPSPESDAREAEQWEHDQRAADYADYIEKMAEEASEELPEDDGRHDDDHDPTATSEAHGAAPYQFQYSVPEIGKPCPNHPSVYQEVIELFGKPYCAACGLYHPGTPHQRNVHQQAQYEATQEATARRTGQYTAIG